MTKDELDDNSGLPDGTLPEPPSLDLYWQLTIVGTDWARLFGIWLAEQGKQKAFETGDLYLGASGVNPAYWLSRKRFTPMALGKFLGQPVHTVQLAKTIMLKPLKGMDQDALATVPYFGIA